MKFHDGEKRVNKVDGLKRRERRRYHKATRKASKRIVRRALRERAD
jgi:hypothetical protein